MPIVSVRIPQLGEGLHEALLIELLKQPGDVILRDEPIYTMETDKATTDVESPYAGTLIEWLAKPNSVLPIGGVIAKMEVAASVEENPSPHGSASNAVSSAAPASPFAPVTSVSKSKLSSSASAADQQSDSPARSPRSETLLIPPKTRRLLLQHGLLDHAAHISHADDKLMPADVLAYVAHREVDSALPNQSIASPLNTSESAALPETNSVETPAATSEHYQTRPLPKSQIVLNYRLGRGTKSCIPVTVMSEIQWTAIQTARESTRATGGPSSFAMACWCVVQSMIEHEKFRSMITSDGQSLKIFHRVNLGVAVALPGDEMVTAVIREADEKSQSEFFEAYQAAVSAARDGIDQADESATLIVSNIGVAGMRMGIPAIVAPAMATLALGEIYSQPIPHGDGFQFVSSVMATMSFDHRRVNGVGAANFLTSFKRCVETFGLENATASR